MKSSIWELSGPKTFIKDIVQDIRNGINVLVHIPNSNFADFNQYLRDELKEDSNYFELDAENFTGTPLEYLSQKYFTERDYNIGSTIDLIEKNNEMNFLWLNLNSLTLQNQVLWFDFLKDYVALCDQKDRLRRVVFIFNTVGDIFKENPSSPFLKGHYFYNYLSNLDYEILVTNSLIESNYAGWKLDILKASICEIAYPNYDLAHYLIYRLEKVNDLSPSLIGSYITERKICIEKRLLFQVSKLRKPGYMDASNPTFFYWINNLITFNNGSIQPSTINYYLRGEEYYIFIKQKIWLAQLKVLFPLLEQYRIEVIGYLSKVGGFNNLRSNNGLGDRLDVYKIEIGKLYYLIVIQKRIKVNNIVSQLIIILREIRNELAHLRILNYSKIENLFDAYSEFETVSKYN